AYRFFDPVNQHGEWTSNPAFANFHTQSTQTQSDCHVGGGLDDRFDFLLISRSILEGSEKVQFIEDSYRTLGQDGLRFNSPLLGLPANFSAPESVLESLAANSDHLPVLLSVVIDQTPAATRNLFSPGALLTTNNPVTDNLIIYHRSLPMGTPFELTIYSITGTAYSTVSDTLYSNPVEIDLSHLASGFYLVKIRLLNTTGVFKIIKL
ncbi:MAG TPA: T9SS type A sorting domain-containing protein, partial [Bacteroidales bacterium]|nr:T9SS type A sorting domain-containing protein [Bacteroidales bacterium]